MSLDGGTQECVRHDISAAMLFLPMA